MAAIDAIAKEDLMFGLSQTEKINPKADINHSTRLLKIAQKKWQSHLRHRVLEDLGQH
jgi:hypothetical protein